MKKKIYLSALCFLVTFAISASLSSLMKRETNPATQLKIYKFLKKDLENRRESSKIERDETGRNVWSFIKRREKYIEVSVQMNTQDLPEDFQAVWQKHLNLCQQWLDFIKNLESMPTQTILNAREIKVADKQIAEQKYVEDELDSIANSYGVEVDSSGNVTMMRE
jgi:hypothetical protein